jgi:hypothetical protein
VRFSKVAASISISIQSQPDVCKVNALTTLLTIPNVGIETSIGKKSTFQVDVLASLLEVHK